MFLGVEISALQRHWAVQMCKQVFMFMFLLLVEYQVWLFALRSGVTQSTVWEKSFLWQWKPVSKSIKGWPKNIVLSHGLFTWWMFPLFFVMDIEMNEVVVPHFKNTHVEMQGWGGCVLGFYSVESRSNGW